MQEQKEVLKRVISKLSKEVLISIIVDNLEDENYISYQPRFLKALADEYTKVVYTFGQTLISTHDEQIKTKNEYDALIIKIADNHNTVRKENQDDYSFMLAVSYDADLKELDQLKLKQKELTNLTSKVDKLRTEHQQMYDDLQSLRKLEYGLN